ncbi:hypothetical protein BDR26DRAFT_1009781 [Obelidium mucronatum]|nr:hypothetical protein BDR26DRAFT_1009781 [Obelidium mucronatum]
MDSQNSSSDPTPTTNSDGSAGNPAIFDSQYAILGVVLGMSIEICLTGIITTLIRVFQGGQMITTGNFNIVAAIMAGFNVICIAYQSILSWVFFLSPDYCRNGTLAGNISSHFFNLVFDLFMLYKTLSISGGNFKVEVTMYLILLNRLAWGITDMFKSHGEWDANLNTCVYNQFPLTGLGFISSDMISHAFSGLIALIYGCMHVMTQAEPGSGDSMTMTIAKTLIDGNILRCLVVLGIHSYAIYAYQNFKNDPYASNVALLVEIYIWARVVNAEHFYSVGSVSYARPSAAMRSSVSEQSVEARG